MDFTVHIDAGEFFSVDIEVHIEMAGFVLLDNLEEVPSAEAVFARTFSKKVFSLATMYLHGTL